MQYFTFPSSLEHLISTCYAIECNRQQLLSGGVVPALVGCLTFLDSVVQASAVRALGMLAIDQTARQQVWH